MTSLENYNFAHWLKLVFDHPDYDAEWYFDLHWHDPYEENPALAIQYLTRLFENSAELLAPYSNTQIGQSLWYIASNTCSMYMFALTNDAVPMADRVRYIQSIAILYEQVFGQRCAEFLSHALHDANDPRANPLNTTCYMWWDLIPLVANPQEHNLIDNAILDVMEKTLAIPHIACQESALHGLGHWQFEYPERVTKIVNEFIQRHPNLDRELLNYAQSAKIGCVL